MSDHSGLSSRAIIGSFYEALETSNQNSWVNEVGMEFNSNQESETYKWLGQSPMLREWVGNRQAKAMRENGITVTNKRFEASVYFDVDDIRRDKTGQIKIRIGEMADRATDHWAKILSTLVTANGTCYDGKAFFATNHSEGDSGTLKNLLTSSEVGALNVSDPDNPTANEMAQVILGLIQYQYGFLDDQGEPMNGNARSFVVVVPVHMWAAAQQAVSSNMLSTGTGAIDNPIKGIDGLRIRVVCNPRFSTARVLYCFRADGRAKPFILQNEEGLTTQVLAEGSEEEIKNNRWFFGCKALRNVGYGLWQQALKATLS